MSNRVLHLLRDWPPPPSTPPAAASGSSGAKTVVQADAGPVVVHLERYLDDGSTWLEIENGDALYEDHGMLRIASPEAVRSLVSALLELMANPHAADILASAKPDDDEAEDEDDQQ